MRQHGACSCDDLDGSLGLRSGDATASGRHYSPLETPEAPMAHRRASRCNTGRPEAACVGDHGTGR